MRLVVDSSSFVVLSRLAECCGLGLDLIMLKHRYGVEYVYSMGSKVKVKIHGHRSQYESIFLSWVHVSNFEVGLTYFRFLVCVSKSSAGAARGTAQHAM